MLFDLEGPQPHRLALTEWQEQLSVLTVLGVEPGPHTCWANTPRELPTAKGLEPGCPHVSLFDSLGGPDTE